MRPSQNLTLSDIARRNGHSVTAIWKAVRRFKLKPILRAGPLKCYSIEQADYLRNNMRKTKSNG